MKLLLGPIMGAVTRTKAKVWIFYNRGQGQQVLPQCVVFKDENCIEKISQSPFNTISSSVHEIEGIHGIAGLAEISLATDTEKSYYRIVFNASDQSENNQTYTIRRSPEVGADIDSLSFALISCHRPSFKPGKDKKRVARMWRYLEEKMREHDCRFLIQAGDQVYADKKPVNAWEKSLQAVTHEERLNHYRQTYLRSWDFLEVQQVMRTFPQYMIWDDHEIANGWGSDEKHWCDAASRKVFEAARQAYIEFQHSHNPDSLRDNRLYFAFNYGPIAFLFLDLRGHRDINRFDRKAEGGGYPLAGRQQWDDVRTWLNREDVRESKMLCVVASVPVLHLSGSFGSLRKLKNDIADQWSMEHNKKERRILLDLLYGWSGERKCPVLILGGDVHVGTLADVMEVETKTRIHQITSSPITNKTAWYVDIPLALLGEKFDFHLEENEKRRVKGRITKRVRRRNFAIVDVKFADVKPSVTVHLYRKGWGRLKVESVEYHF